MNTTSLSVKSPAKINLFLHVHQLRDDGYHDLKTYFQFVDLCDTLTFSITDANQIQVHNPKINTPQESDLCHRAAQLLKPYCQGTKGVTIDVEKKIPCGGGLGGGSSNAATVLYVLNQLWEIYLPQEKLLQLALRLGSDVPIFIHGCSSYAEGRGERFSSHIASDILLGKAILIVKPKVHAATPEIFQSPLLNKRSSAKKISNLKSVLYQNDFEHTVFQMYPKIAEAAEQLAVFSPAHLTGTGACLYAIVDNWDDGALIAEQLKEAHEVFLCRPLSHSPLQSTVQSVD